MHRFFKTPVMIHTAIASCALILTAFLNLGSVRVLDELFGREIRQKKSLSIKAITQGFSLAAMMSPYIAGVAIVLYLLDVSFFPFLIYAMIMAVSGIGITIGLNLLAFRNARLPGLGIAASRETSTVPADQNELDKGANGKGVQLLFAFVGLFLSIFLMEEWLQINLIVIISLAAILYPFVWVLFIRGRDLLPKYLQHYFKEVLPNVHNESVLVVGAAFFSKMVQLTPFPELLSRMFRSLHDFSVFMTVLTVLVVIVGLSLFGIHQILPITVLASSVSAQSIGLSPVLYALTLTVSWGLVTSVSPISAMNIISSSLFQMNSWQLAKWNWKYVGMMILFTTVAVNLLNHH
jgi:TRAP-type C4-dicarboxylate transport system permease large subunit